MPRQRTFRWLGVIAIVAGILNLLSALSEPEQVVFWIRKFGDASSAVALVGIFAFQRDRTGVFGMIATFIGVAGALLMFAGVDYGMALGVYGLGVILLAIEMLRTKCFPRWIPACWLLSPIVGVPSAFVPSLAGPAGLLAAGIFVAGYCGVGYTMLRAQPEDAAS